MTFEEAVTITPTLTLGTEWLPTTDLPDKLLWDETAKQDRPSIYFFRIYSKTQQSFWRGCSQSYTSKKRRSRLV